MRASRPIFAALLVGLCVGLSAPSYAVTATYTVPASGALILFGSALAGLGLLWRRRSNDWVVAAI